MDLAILHVTVFSLAALTGRLLLALVEAPESASPDLPAVNHKIVTS
ncbi:hypothetical protein [Bradyrhizobium sp.]|jgi:hypothetical protein